MSGTGYEVDLDYLRDTIAKLQGVVTGMDAPCTKVNYNTNLTRQQFGSDAFAESGTLHAAHDSMKTQLAEMIQTLQNMIQEFTDKTTAVHGAYAEQEAATTRHFNASAS
jgi:Holliday junction resolvasome RuvABC endonuclease subunit